MLNIVMFSKRLSYRRTWVPKQKLPTSLRTIDFLIQVDLKNVSMTPTLSESIANWYKEQYMLPLFRWGPRRVNLQTTDRPGVYYITGKIPELLYDDIYQHILTPEPIITLNNTTYEIRGMEVY
jgi:hypothetical protein